MGHVHFENLVVGEAIVWNMLNMETAYGIREAEALALLLWPSLSSGPQPTRTILPSRVAACVLLAMP